MKSDAKRWRVGVGGGVGLQVGLLASVGATATYVAEECHQSCLPAAV